MITLVNQKDYSKPNHTTMYFLIEVCVACVRAHRDCNMTKVKSSKRDICMHLGFGKMVVINLRICDHLRQHELEGMVDYIICMIHWINHNN